MHYTTYKIYRKDLRYQNLYNHIFVDLPSIFLVFDGHGVLLQKKQASQ